jgi:hypothetical protein
MAIQVHAQYDVDYRIFESVFAPQLDVQGVQENIWIDGFQWTALPRFDQRPSFVGDGADCLGGDLYALQVKQSVLDVSGIVKRYIEA